MPLRTIQATTESAARVLAYGQCDGVHKWLITILYGPRAIRGRSRPQALHPIGNRCRGEHNNLCLRRPGLLRSSCCETQHPEAEQNSRRIQPANLVIFDWIYRYQIAESIANSYWPSNRGDDEMTVEKRSCDQADYSCPGGHCKTVLRGPDKIAVLDPL